MFIAGLVAGVFLHAAGGEQGEDKQQACGGGFHGVRGAP